MKKFFGLPVLARVLILTLVGVLMLGALTFAGIKLVNAANEIWACSIDADGSNDEVNQGDMTQMCTDIYPGNSGTFGIKWSWDDLVGPGGNKYFACSLFDTDEDGNANNAVCVQIIAADITGELIEYANWTYTCGDDSPYKCTQPLVGTLNDSVCLVQKTDTDPFPGALATEDTPGGMGNAYPWDTTAECSVANTLVGGEAATLINVCSFTSDNSPNSDPKDCIFETTTVNAFLTIDKIATADDTGVTFGYTVTGPTSVSKSIIGSGITDRFQVAPGGYSITESMPSGWELTDVSCTESGIPLTITGMNPISFTASSYDDIVCTFTNHANADIEVNKGDGDYGVYPYPRINNPYYDYTVTVINHGPASAYNVVMSDTLDAKTSFDAASPITVGGIEVSTDVCWYTNDDANPGGGTVTCNLGDMALDESKEIVFGVKIEPGVPTMGILEIGETCTAGGMNADICNTVVVTTSSTDLIPANNTELEPKDVGAPTAVELLYFEGSGAKNSVILQWATASELETLGFNLYRRAKLDGTMRPINSQLIQAESVGLVEGSSYQVVVDGLKPGKYYYFWLEDFDVYGNSTIHGPIYVKAKRNNP